MAAAGIRRIGTWSPVCGRRVLRACCTAMAPGFPQQPLGFFKVLRAVGIEKRIARPCRKIHMPAAMPVAEAFNLADAMAAKGLAQIIPERNAPETHHRVQTPAACGKDDVGIRRRGTQPVDEIAGKEGTVGRHDQREGVTWALCADPIEPGKDSGQRSQPLPGRIRGNRQGECGKTRRIAIGIEQKNRRLRLHAADHMRQERNASQQPKAFVAPAHARRATPCKEDGWQLLAWILLAN